MVLSNVLSGASARWGRWPLWTGWRAAPKMSWLAATGDQTSATPSPTDAEKIGIKKVQRRQLLLVASTAAAISWAGSHLFLPPLHLVSVPITLAAALPILRDSAVALRNRQMDVATVSSVALIGSLILQQTTVAALIDVAHYSGQAALEWWQQREATQTAYATAQGLYANSKIYLVHCWREDRGESQPVMRYVLEAPSDAARHGFAQLTDLIDVLRDKMVVPQETATSVAILSD